MDTRCLRGHPRKQTYKMIPPTSAKNAQQEAKQHYNYNGHDAPREDAPTSDNNNAKNQTTTMQCRVMSNAVQNGQLNVKQ